MIVKGEVTGVPSCVPISYNDLHCGKVWAIKVRSNLSQCSNIAISSARGHTEFLSFLHVNSALTSTIVSSISTSLLAPCHFS
jgi:hypothetical protein